MTANHVFKTTTLLSLCSIFLTSCSNSDPVAEPYLGNGAMKVSDCGIKLTKKYLGYTEYGSDNATRMSISLEIEEGNTYEHIDLHTSDIEVSEKCQIVRNTLGGTGLDYWKGDEASLSDENVDGSIYYDPSISIDLKNVGPYLLSDWDSQGRPKYIEAELEKATIAIRYREFIPSISTGNSSEIHLQCDKPFQIEYAWGKYNPRHNPSENCEFNEEYEEKVCLLVLPYASFTSCQISAPRLAFLDAEGGSFAASLKGSIEKVNDGYELIVNEVSISE